jgi:hypothetical protein
VIAACQLVLMGGPEYARYVGIESLQPVGVFLPGTQPYPGGVPFDPLQYSRRPSEFLEQQVWLQSLVLEEEIMFDELDIKFSSVRVLLV